jgi:hypothetical protein
MIKYLPILTIVLALGCNVGPQKIEVDAPALVSYTPFMAWQITKLPDLAPTPEPDGIKIGDTCPNCHGTGIVGDGRTAKSCKDCKADGKVDEGDPILGVTRSVLVQYYIQYNGKEYVWTGRSFTHQGLPNISFTDPTMSVERTENISVCNGKFCQTIPIYKR